MRIIVAGLSVVLLTGCYGTSRRVAVADVDPSSAARQAIELYDTNSDSKLNDDELGAVPGVLKWKSLYDLDADGFVSRAEISQRIKKWQSDKIGLRSLSARVTLDGRPLQGAEVMLTPEPYLEEVIKPASGVTNARGYASLSVAPDDLPEAIKQRGIQVPGVYPGTYKIGVSHPQRRLPSATADGIGLGDEIARDTVNTSITIDLFSR
jgi:hypothetical protein